MVLSIKDPEADRLAREVAAQTGETLTSAVINALRERLERERQKAKHDDWLAEDVLAIAHHLKTLPVRDARSPDEMLYDGDGLPA
jgi:antitoxin VapB